MTTKQNTKVLVKKKYKIKDKEFYNLSRKKEKVEILKEDKA